jgi:hypothetical protein
MIGHPDRSSESPVTVPATTGTPTEVAAVLQNLPASDPLSIGVNTVPAGSRGVVDACGSGGLATRAGVASHDPGRPGLTGVDRPMWW